MNVPIDLFVSLAKLQQDVASRESWDFDGAVQLARAGIRNLGLNPDDFLFKMTPMVVREPYYDFCEKVLSRAARDCDNVALSSNWSRNPHFQ